jgi:hypothetical protein
MKTQWALLILVALGSVSCSQSEPIIGIEQLEGEYRAASCPNIIIRGNLLVTSDGQTSFDLIRIKQDDILATASTPRVALTGRCKLVMVSEPSYISIDRSAERFAFEVLSLDRTEAVRFAQTE